MAEGEEKSESRKSGSSKDSRTSKVESPKSESQKVKAERLKAKGKNTAPFVPAENKSDPDSYRDEHPTSEIKELPTANSKLPTEPMEVHHHPEVEKKGLKEYFFEGLMIFLAVMMGYFAESARDHLSDRAKEKD